MLCVLIFVPFFCFVFCFCFWRRAHHSSNSEKRTCGYTHSKQKTFYCHSRCSFLWSSFSLIAIHFCCGIPRRNATQHECYKYSAFTCTSLFEKNMLNPLKPELNPICYLLALLGTHHFLHVSRIRVKLLTFKRLMSYIWSTHS